MQVDSIQEKSKSRHYDSKEFLNVVTLALLGIFEKHLELAIFMLFHLKLILKQSLFKKKGGKARIP